MKKAALGAAFILVASLFVSAPPLGSRSTAALQLPAFPLSPARASSGASPEARVGVPRPLQRHQHVDAPPSARVGPGPGGSHMPSRAGSTPAPATRPPTSPNAAPSGLRGLASWYDAGGGLYGAMPGYVDGSRAWVRVCAIGGCVQVRIVTQCQCYVHTSQAKVIDLSPAAFRLLAPLSAGVVRVTVARLP